MIPFPSIGQFREVVRKVQHSATLVGVDEAGQPIHDHSLVPPKLRFRGSVKLHGTNAAIVLSPDGMSFQSRGRVLTPEDDNAGFCSYMQPLARQIKSLILAEYPLLADDTLAIYGEWCGGSIQKNVAITGLPKMFVIFAVKLNDNWVNLDQFPKFAGIVASIYSITLFPQFDITIDFAAPGLSQNELGAITEQVETSCPVGLHFDSPGVGEGVVWRCLENFSSDYWFKVKGEKHSASKVKTLASVNTEQIQAISDFVLATVTENRLEQGLQNLIIEQKKPFEMSSMGDFIRWVYGDIVKEESDTIEQNGFDLKELGKPIATAARQWYSKKLQQS